MPYLQCSMTDCASNRTGCCCRPSISVAGLRAHDSGETCCHSFTLKGAGEMSDSLHYSVANHVLSIGCSAESCVYNGGGMCKADSVSIRGEGCDSQCDTFKPAQGR